MLLSLNEIRSNTIAFSREWAGETRERAEKDSFWNDFFAVFGIKRKAVAAYEAPVKMLSGKYGHIDLFWKGKFLAEHKSAGQSLDKAHSQAMDYIQALTDEGRHKEVPRYVAVCDYRRMALYDLEADAAEPGLFDFDSGAAVEFDLADFHKYVDYFRFIPGYKIHKLAEQNPVDLEAADLLGRFRDLLEAGGYSGHNLERLLVRVLFCLFAEDTGLFDRDAFKLYIEDHTQEDGSDLGMHLAKIFDVLKKEARPAHLIEELAELPYVNGDLFAETLDFADTNREMRNALLTCCGFDWSKISPAVFGSLFQSVLEKPERRKAGAHYTSERDILKLINSLFLDDLRAELAAILGSSTRRVFRLAEFHDKLGRLKFFDPACGCGNFLVVAYRELRRLEIELLKATGIKQGVIAVESLSKLSVAAFYGIEINEFPAQIAQVAMWLVNHQMNLELALAFGIPAISLPLKQSATIRKANALRVDWNDVLPAKDCSYVLGNPPFIGHQWRSEDQQVDMATIWGTDGRYGRLDYVTAWYRKAADYMDGLTLRAAFVSTNSICQGEQVGTMWGYLLRRGLKIQFAHRTFVWHSEARGKAHVHVVIIGFGYSDVPEKHLYDYDAGTVAMTVCKNINPYLVSGSDMVLPSRTDTPLNMPQMIKGSQPTDGGYLILSDEERMQLVGGEPLAEKWIRRYMGGDDFIGGSLRWCLWLKVANPSELRKCPKVMARVERVRQARLQSPTKSVRDFADKPTIFTQDRQPESDYLAVPEVSSIRRRYIPIGFLQPSVIASNKIQMIVGCNQYHFGVLCSTMHMAWVRSVAGRLKSDYSYAPSVYNNFPWPDASEKQQANIIAKAQGVLDARAQFPQSSLADLYDPTAMPPVLTEAHAELDRAVEKCYRKEPFATDRERVEFLFALYEKLANPLTTPAKAKRRRVAE
jgi:type I restriction-modification system DNA methylase subunit